MNVKMHTARVIPMNTMNHVPIDDCANACTELPRPARVNSDPSRVSRNVEKISHMFQLFIMPLFSFFITECINAVPGGRGGGRAGAAGARPRGPPRPGT